MSTLLFFENSAAEKLLMISLVLGPEVKSSSEIMDPGSFTASYQSHRLLLIPHVTLWFPGLSSVKATAEKFSEHCVSTPFSSRPFSIAPNFFLFFSLHFIWFLQLEEYIFNVPLDLFISVFPKFKPISPVHIWCLLLDGGGDNEKTQRVQLQELCKLCMWDEVWQIHYYLEIFFILLHPRKVRIYWKL